MSRQCQWIGGWGVMCVLLLAQWGCGRDALQRSCVEDSECATGEQCIVGACQDVNISQDMDRRDSDFIPDLIVDPPDSFPDFVDPPDIPIDPPDMEPDLEMVMCSSTPECPGGGQEYEDQGLCLKSTCLANNCVYDRIDVGCPPNARQEGCGCVPLMGECIDSDDCGGQACVNNQCQPCRNNTECGELICRDDGVCARCQDDLECAANEICTAGVCEDRPECLLDQDCGQQEVCLNGRCSFSPECVSDRDCADGYECIGDRCFEAICRDPQDCAEDEICDGGLCVDPPATIDRCFVATPSGTVSPGQRTRLEAFAVDAMGNGIAARFSWDSDNVPVARVSGRDAVAGNTAGVARISARLENSPILCEGEVELTNIGPPPVMGGLRIVVQDAETTMPVVGAEVYVGGQALTPTNATGVTTAPVPMGDFEVTVFSDDHDWVTIQGVSATDIRIPLNKRSGTGPIAGFKGEFDTSMLSSQGDFNLGLAGASLPGGLINFELSRLLGDPFLTDISIPGQGDVSFPLPGGLTIYGSVFGFPLNVKRDYFATSPGGARLAWGLAGQVPVNELIALFQGGGIGNVGDVLTLLLPLFNRFDHGIKPLILNAIPRVQDIMDIDGDGDVFEEVPDYSAFAEHDLTPSVRQQLITSVSVSNLPVLTDGPAEFAILVGGTSLDATGYVPLGISATTDNDGDGRPDVRRLTMAPPYSSLVGGRYAIFSIAFRSDAFGAGLGGLEFPDEFSAAIWNGQTLPTSIQLGTFPDTNSIFEDVLTRTLFIDGSTGPLYRARMVGIDRSWDVWSPGPAGNMGFFSHVMNIPDVPPGKVDLLFNANKVLVDSIRTQVRIDDLVKPSGILLYDAALVSTGYSRTRIR